MSKFDEQSDDQLLRLYRDEAVDNDGEPFMAIYMRYRQRVRAELEASGLSPADAESRVGSVFIQAMNNPRDDGLSLRERLLALARAIGADPHWQPP
jgi:hypothetical protein